MDLMVEWLKFILQHLLSALYCGDQIITLALPLPSLTWISEISKHSARHQKPLDSPQFSVSMEITRTPILVKATCAQIL